jgi:hypothetical protein
LQAITAICSTVHHESMPRAYNPGSVRNRPGVTIRPAAADRQLIAAWAKRWGCGVSEAAVRLAVMGAEVGHQDSAIGRVSTVAQWLQDGQEYDDISKQCQSRWAATNDDAHRLIVEAWKALEGAEPWPNQEKQSIWIKAKESKIAEHGSLAVASQRLLEELRASARKRADGRLRVF